MSFRNRLALFFVVIVIVPMLAVAFLLFRLIDRSSTGQAEATIQQQHRTANRLFGEQRELAQIALQREVGGDGRFAAALRDGDIDRAQARIDEIAERRAIERILFVRDGEIVLRAGDRRAIAPAVRPVQSSTGRTLGRLEVSVTDARAYVRRTRDLTGLHAIVLNGRKVLASTLSTVGDRLPAASDGDTITLAGTEYLVHDFTDPDAFSGQQIRVVTLGSLAATGSDRAEDRAFAGVILLGFFLLAIACAVLVSRTLQQEIAGFLTAARRLAAGDFQAHVPTVGHDEFAELGEEFNKMSRELERRLAELGQERGRVQESMRRFGEALARNLDRDALLALVVETAVDGLGASAGRACVGANRDGTPEEHSRVGDVDGLRGILHAVEADAVAHCSARERTDGMTRALAHPLRAADGGDALVGVVSVARVDRPFTDSDRELFRYLAERAASAIENVQQYETAAHESMTDELTDLPNFRALEKALDSEIERSRRYGTAVGFVLVDIDDFKSINADYGWPQANVVLQQVASVLRGASREIDLPARYGGDELAVVVPETDLDGTFNLAERMRQRIAALRVPDSDGGTIPVTASCGVAAVPPTAADRRALADAAAAALLEAKRTGKNKTVRAG